MLNKVKLRDGQSYTSYTVTQFYFIGLDFYFFQPSIIYECLYNTSLRHVLQHTN